MLKTSIAGIALDCCIYNASGPRTGSIEALSKVGCSSSGAILTKSATLSPHSGNSMPRFVNKINLGDSFCQGSVNSEGLPNPGIDYFLSETAVSLSQYSKPYIVSLSGFSLDDNMIMLDKTLRCPFVSSIELNLACPNIPGKPVVGYDFEQMEAVLDKICSHSLIHTKPLGVKLPPYFDSCHITQAITILLKHSAIRYIVAINTIGNGLIVDSESESRLISPKGGLGGLGGGFVKLTALANVRMLYEALVEGNRTDIHIIGVGGISSGKDVFEMILCGASAVQIATCHWTEGPKCFDRLASELRELMQRKGYNSIDDFCGKLKPYDPRASSAACVSDGCDLKLQHKSCFVCVDKTLIFGQWAVIIALISIIVWMYVNKTC